MNIGEKICKLRTSKNIRQNELAKILGVGTTTISNYENNYSTPDVNTLVKISNYFNVTVDYLLDNTSITTRNISLEPMNGIEKEIINMYRNLNSKYKNFLYNILKLTISLNEDTNFENQVNSTTAIENKININKNDNQDIEKELRAYSLDLDNVNKNEIITKKEKHI